MTHDTVLVTGATGSVGRQVVDGLLARGVAVRALTRRPDSAGLPEGVRVFRGDLSEPDAVRAAADGAGRIFVFPAPDLLAALTALAADGTQHAVVLSSSAVLQDEPDASTRMHRAVEDAVDASGLAHTVLRPGPFMSNDLAWSREIAAADTVTTGYPDAPQAPIAEHDIAAVAVAALVDPGAVPPSVEMTGPGSLSIRERVAVIAEVTGRSLGIVEITPARAREEMARAMPTEMVDIILGHLAEAPAVAPTLPAPASALGRAPMSYRDWVVERRTAFDAALAHR